jgi:hypothetical protein
MPTVHRSAEKSEMKCNLPPRQSLTAGPLYPTFTSIFPIELDPSRNPHTSPLVLCYRWRSGSHPLIPFRSLPIPLELFSSHANVLASSSYCRGFFQFTGHASQFALTLARRPASLSNDGQFRSHRSNEADEAARDRVVPLPCRGESWPLNQPSLWIRSASRLKSTGRH